MNGKNLKRFRIFPDGAGVTDLKTTLVGITFDWIKDHMGKNSLKCHPDLSGVIFFA